VGSSVGDTNNHHDGDGNDHIYRKRFLHG
jgi:hypothetical protein